MTGRVRLTEAAEVDLYEATAWYAQRAPSMSVAFLEAVNEVIDRIARNPLAFPEHLDDVRQVSLRRPFPYALWFVVQPDESVVIAALHHRQDRRVLRGRTP